MYRPIDRKGLSIVAVIFFFISVIIFGIVGLLGCGDATFNEKERFRKLKRPLVCIAKEKGMSAVFLSKDGDIYVAKTTSFMGIALVSSYNVGDTIR